MKSTILRNLNLIILESFMSLWKHENSMYQNLNDKLTRADVGLKYTYTMILLIGIWISFTKNPINPMIQKPIAVATAIFWNSENVWLTALCTECQGGTRIWCKREYAAVTFPVGFCATFHQSDWVLYENSQRFNNFGNLIHDLSNEIMSILSGVAQIFNS